MSSINLTYSILVYFSPYVVVCRIYVFTVSERNTSPKSPLIFPPRKLQSVNTLTSVLLSTNEQRISKLNSSQLFSEDTDSNDIISCIYSFDGRLLQLSAIMILIAGTNMQAKIVYKRTKHYLFITKSDYYSNILLSYEFL